ncbi:DUF5996 family protein [Mucilaginibacter sp.]|uniref:DUF5996 family protein n=1 Tax=Mucilaginibacter sp. TaxID=1882438 RepID=UPI00262D2E43|nr:DUF5996 family protein [Mucilaginibacter sp.]MDB4927459.1 hypothetical protein [Mucilaginibacter sp.]
MTTNTNWPELIFDQLKDTVATVQLWTQIVGKIRLKKTPWLNHSWHVTLYVYPRGLTTHSISYGDGSFQIDFDFIAHELIVTCSSGESQRIELYPRTVASFYKELFEKLKILGIDVTIYAKPNEIDPAIPFEQDDIHRSYDKEQINKFFKALLTINTIFTGFRSKFSGKCSPVHFFWGAFDLAVTRFSGRRAPLHPGGIPNMPDRVTQEAYSHEVSSCGFWPGNEQFPYPTFYAYCYPTPAAFSKQPVKPTQAFYSTEMGEFFLKYDDVRLAANPEKTLLEFLETTYIAAANTGNWDRNALECDFSWLER